MIVWAATSRHPHGCPYEPITDSRHLGADLNTPAARYRHSAVWTGTEMIIWGGRDFRRLDGTGGR
jgi:hypothetical protein